MVFVLFRFFFCFNPMAGGRGNACKPSKTGDIGTVSVQFKPLLFNICISEVVLLGELWGSE